MAELNQTQIPSPRVPFLKAGSDVISREWFAFFREITTRTRIAQSLSTIFFSGLTTITGDYTPTNQDIHLICDGTTTITLQPPAERNSELIVTNAGTGEISFIGTVNGVTDMQMGLQWTSVRLRPTLTGWVIV